MATISFDLVSPENLIFNDEVGMIIVPGKDGDLGVLPGHSKLVSSLRPGSVMVYGEDKNLLKSFFLRLIPISLHIGMPMPPPVSRRKLDLEATTNQLQKSINFMLDQIKDWIPTLLDALDMTLVCNQRKNILLQSKLICEIFFYAYKFSLLN